jgi:D-serine deaminase-like pyridoxal phosphate-dependent protein
MSVLKPCEVGDAVDQILTPALVLEHAVFERNLSRMMQAVGDVRVRPHAKSHKCPAIAKRQLERGAVGICCQKLSEAMVFAQAGITDILLTNQVVGQAKLAHLADLAQSIRLGVLVDDTHHVKALAQAMVHKTRAIDVYIEVEVGGQRCGVLPSDVVDVAQVIDASDQLRFAGLHAYHGAAQHYREPRQRQAAIDQACDVVRQVIGELRQIGIETPCITGAGTGTFWLERDSGLYTELQPGSYVFMDRDYADNTAAADDVRFEHALFVYSTVMSVSHPEFVVVDAGLKSLSVDSGMPSIADELGLTYARASDEHGVIQTTKGKRPDLGQTLKLIPGHCDPTVNLYDDLIVVADGKVIDIWPIAARGASL